MPGYVSKEQIERAKAVPILDYLLSHEGDNFKRVGNAYYRRDPDHNSLEVSNNLWNWHSHGVGGNLIDYLIKINGYSFVDAVRHLAGDDQRDAGPNARPIPPKARPPNSVQQPEREPFRLPPRNVDNRRVIAYLESRRIDMTLIDDCIRRGALYESANWHNCVFVGRDDGGKARFAALRGTVGDFKRDADGSDKRFGFTLPPDNPQSNTVFVYESPIDLLSYVTLCKLGSIESQDGWRLSLGGTAMAALTQLIEQQKFKTPIAHCVVCTDHDTAGDLAFSNISEKLTIKVSRQIPVGKDWNETLQQIRNEVNPLEDKRKDIIFRDSDYKEKFRIKDGESIKFTSGYDGKVSVAKCRWIDECHTKIGSEHYHVDEWAEICARNGHRIEAAKLENKLDILAAKYGEALQDVTVPMTEAALRKLVGGKFETETLYYPNQTNQIKDRIVEIKGKAFGAILHGKDGIAVCGLTDGVLTSLQPYNAQTQKREFGIVEPPAAIPPEKSADKPAPEKPDFLGKIGKFKAQAAAQPAKPASPAKSRDALE
jgi:hypothetical protein